MTTQIAFLSEIDAFLASTGMAESTFGKLAAKDGKFLRRLRSGGTLTVNTLDAVRRFMKEQAKAPAQ